VTERRPSMTEQERADREKGESGREAAGRGRPLHMAGIGVLSTPYKLGLSLTFSLFPSRPPSLHANTSQFASLEDCYY